MGKKKVTDQQRWSIIGLLKDGSKTEREIAEIVGVSQKCVNTTKRNYQATSRVHNFGNCGRPLKLSDRDISYIFRFVRKNPTISYRQIAADFNSKFDGQVISRETVRRIFSKKGINSYSAVKKPLLTVSDRIKRLKWCKERRSWTDRDWAKVIFSDESNFEVLNRKSRVFVKRFKSEKYHPKFCVPRVQKGGGSVGIWGCMSYEGVGCCSLYSERINQFIYMETLEDHLIPSVQLFFEHDQEWIFQQDGAPAHTANSVKNWFREHDIRILPWCPRSPDLNPIENLWSYIDHKLLNYRITSVEHLKQVLHDEWIKFQLKFVKI